MHAATLPMRTLWGGAPNSCQSSSPAPRGRPQQARTGACRAQSRKKKTADGSLSACSLRAFAAIGRQPATKPAAPRARSIALSCNVNELSPRNECRQRPLFRVSLRFLGFLRGLGGHGSNAPQFGAFRQKVRPKKTRLISSIRSKGGPREDSTYPNAVKFLLGVAGPSFFGGI